MNIVHLHLLLNHIPVVGALIGIALFTYAVIRRNSEVAKITLALFVILAVIAGAVFFTGEPAEEAIEHLPGFSSALTERHEELARVSTLGFVGFALLGLATLAYYRRRQLPRWITATGLAISLTIGGLMAATANLGGQIRHSEIRAAAVAGDRGSEEQNGEQEHR